ncbi:hypothetical protein NW752_009810 [Fusarium irregulare]|uniref:Uncharacterized protein n=1 Tax=Fusarium irregulare TaxID=2494466 RepID=A0A9W8PZV9_9HYPO|nr:hypothetical protein NW752_009810 [Fusarium irregulare]KAJ4020984.1 hypothetical protein NW766_002480 [Fusarium irregulare]
MRPLVSRLSQVMRPIALDQRSKMLCQNRITSRSPLLGVLRLPAQRASFAPNHFASSQIRALHTTLQTRTPRDHKTEGRKATNKSGQPLKGSELSDREVWEKVKEMIISLSRIYPALQRDHDKGMQ